MADLLQRIQDEIQNRHLLARGGKMLVAVSGGVDSMVLLHALKNLSARHKWKITVAHFNHQLRGRASNADEKLVQKTAARLNLPLVSDCSDVKSFARQSKLSVEMAARKLRHEFFARVARERKIKTIALAHHADDQVELFFLRLLRGAGGEGLAGMKWKSPSPADKEISLVRPLLGFSKSRLLAFARENRIRFRNDATNLSSDHLRNRIRNELLPLLREKYQPGLNETILRAMEIVGAEAESVGATARQGRGRTFDQLHAAAQRRVLQMELTEKGIAADFDLIESLRRAPDVYVNVGPGLSVARDGGGGIKLRTAAKTEFNSNELPVELSGRAGEAIFAGAKFRWKILNGSPGRSPRQKKSSGEYFDADKIGGKILLRHWRAGDRFQPIGMKSPKKLQDLFVNAKIPAGRRRNLILAEASNREIFWVEGLRIGENFKLTPATRRKLAWRCK